VSHHWQWLNRPHLPDSREKFFSAREMRHRGVKYIRQINIVDTIWPSLPAAEFGWVGSGLAGEFGGRPVARVFRIRILDLTCRHRAKSAGCLAHSCSWTGVDPATRRHNAERRLPAAWSLARSHRGARSGRNYGVRIRQFYDDHYRIKPHAPCVACIAQTIAAILLLSGFGPHLVLLSRLATRWIHRLLKSLNSFWVKL
jgi:hypothetical protein